MSTTASVRVVCRFRPLNDREINVGSHANFLEFDSSNTSISVDFNNKKDQFNFDRVFGGEEAIAASKGKSTSSCTQEQVWKEVGEKGVIEVTKGYMATIFAYGQTGAGKSFSMLGTDFTSKNRGIIPRACQAIFDFIQNDKEGIEFQVKCSFLEIYKEVIRDLLRPGGSALRVRETPQKGVWVDGLSERFVGTMEEVMELLETGEKFRACAFTQMNATSSRSHSLFTITLIQKTSDGTEKIGKLNLADLAGSEKVGKTGATGNTLKEAMKINQSLSALGNCINALSKASGKKRGHIPYRDSKLTHILKESLGGNSKTTLLIACSPHYSNADETVSTLRFGQRAKTIKNKVTARIHRSVEELNAIITKLQKEITFLKKHITLLESELTKRDSSIDLKEIKSKIQVPVSQTKSLFNSTSDNSQDIDDDDDDENDDEENDDQYNSMEVAELQLSIDKLKEQSEFTISNLEEQLQTSSELLEEKEENLTNITKELISNKSTLRELQSNQESLLRENKNKIQELEKQLYESNLQLEKEKQKKNDDNSLDYKDIENKKNELERQCSIHVKSLDSLAVKTNKLTEQLKQKDQLLKVAEETIQNLTQKTITGDKLLDMESAKFSALVTELQTSLHSKTLEVEKLEESIETIEEELEEAKRIPIDYEREKKITTLEIDLEGQKRLCVIQETRCKQLQSLTDEQSVNLQRLHEEAEKNREKIAEQENEIIKLRKQVQVYQEAEILNKKIPSVKVVKPISQPRSISSIIGQRKKRDNLPKRFSIQETVKEGYLTKQGGFIRSWKRRWFVLKENPPLLYYFDSENAVDPKGAIALDGCVLQLADTETKRYNTLGIYHDTRRTYYIQATSDEELISWKSSIECVINTN